MKHYNIWPEVVVFWGAGATNQLKMPSTAEQESFLTAILIENDYKKLKLSCVNEDETKDFIQQLKNDDRYSFRSLIKIAEMVPKQVINKERKLIIQDLFNIIDMQIQIQKGLQDKYGAFIELSEILKARDTLKVIIIFLLSIRYKELINSDEKNILMQYNGFCKAIGELMLEEGLLLQNEVSDFTDKKFYLESLAFISLNWDPLLLWQMFCANKELNDIEYNCIGKYCEPLKLFNDFSTFMTVRKIEKEAEDNNIWYPANETVISRLNEKNKRTSRKIRIGKFYFPHGSLAWRECPNCGKLSSYLGGDWKIDSVNLFPPNIGNNFGFSSKNKEEGQKTGIILCPFCSEKMEVKHTEIIMQSNFKLNYPPYIEEIQRDMKVAISKAKHLVFMGYSLPKDDLIYRSILSTKIKSDTVITIVLGYDKNAKDKFLDGKELEEYLKNAEDDIKSIYKFFKDLLSEKGKIRIYFKGIPNVFAGSNKIEIKERVKELFYPNNMFFENIEARKSL